MGKNISVPVNNNYTGEVDKLIDVLNLNEPVYIQVHKVPDPDAISSAAGLQFILENRGIPSTIIYTGAISRAETRLNAQMCGIELINTQELENKGITITPIDNLILVDCQYGNANVEDIGGDPIACIDHHQIYATHDYKYELILPNIGSCATIVYSLIRTEDLIPTQEIALALLYGLKIDTLDLSRGVSDEDVEVFCDLHRMVDLDKLQKLQKGTKNFGDLLAYREAFGNLLIQDGICYVYMGYNKPNEVMAEVSEFLLSVEEIDFVVTFTDLVSGVRFSVRSNKAELNAGNITSGALSSVGDGGGHPHMAGGFVDSINLVGMSDGSAKIRFFIQKFSGTILEMTQEAQKNAKANKLENNK